MAAYRVRFLFLIVLFGGLGVGLSGSASAGEGARNLTLKEAIRMAVEKNLEVRAELYNPAMNEAEIRRNRGIYDPLVVLSSNYQQSTTQSASTVISGASISRQKNFLADAGISQLVPIGGTVGLFFNNLWNRNNADSSRGFLNDYWRSDLTASYSQPLLKNFGRESTELAISVAVNNKTASIDQFENKLIEIVNRVRTAYFTLYSLKENLEAKKTALTLAQKIHEETQGRVRAGVLPAMENLNSEFGVATREKELIDAEKLLQDQMDVVRSLLQIEGEQELNATDNRPVSYHKVLGCYPHDSRRPVRVSVDNLRASPYKRSSNRHGWTFGSNCLCIIIGKGGCTAGTETNTATGPGTGQDKKDIAANAGNLFGNNSACP